MIVSSNVNRVALIVALVLAGTIAWIGFRDSEPLLIVLGPALFAVAALIKGDAGPMPAAIRRPPQHLEPLAPPSSEVERLMLDGRKIAAIKQYRDETGAGLRQAKDAVEALERRIRPGNRAGA